MASEGQETSVNEALLYQKPPYVAMLIWWYIYRDAYFGRGGFENGNYLDKGINEVDYRYDIRKAAAIYLNLFRPAIDKFLGWLFSGTINYGNDASDAFKDWAESVHLVKNLKKAAKYALIYGNSPIIVDQASEAVKGKPNEPYIVPYSPMSLYDWQENLDVSGDTTGRYDSAKIVIENLVSDVAQGVSTPMQTVLLWTPEVMQKWTIEEGEDADAEINEENKLEYAPLANLDFTSGDDETVNVPIFDSLARMCLAIFNTMSEQWAYATSGLIHPQIAVPHPKGREKPVYTPGHNMLYYDPVDGGAPNKLEASSGPYSAFGDQTEKFIEQAAYAAGLNGPASYIYPKSGEAYKQQSVDTVAILKSMTKELEKTIINIANIWNDMTGSKTDHNVDPKWPEILVDVDNFSLDDIMTHQNSKLYDMSPKFAEQVDLAEAKILARGNIKVFHEMEQEIKTLDADARGLIITTGEGATPNP